MEFGLEGKQALVLGASAGLGAAAAMELASEGVQVTINSRSQENLVETAETIASATGSKPSTLVGDLTKSEDVAGIARHIAKNKFDIVVSNVGGPPAGQLAKLAEAEWDKAHAQLLKSAVEITRAALEGMIERKYGRLIYITSIAVLQPVDSLILSNTYRAGVTAFAKTISNNYAAHGITANCVCPGYTATERLNDLAEKLAQESRSTIQQVLEDFAASCPARRLGEPEELAALITFLASERAGYITGASIPVDGGANKSLI
jgi:3-oxoacyl-[acyl-carrier protein] reductase